MQYLAAIKFGDGEDIDGLLESFANEQMNRGLIVKGVLQVRTDTLGECHCADMDLLAIGEKTVFRISQPLGNGSSGCRLHPGALADCSAHLDAAIRQGADLLVLNRFGKGESEGRGFRDLISSALELDIPVLVAVRSTYSAAWEAFSGDCGVTLPFDHGALRNWIDGLEQADAA